MGQLCQQAGPMPHLKLRKARLVMHSTIVRALKAFPHRAQDRDRSWTSESLESPCLGFISKGEGFIWSRWIEHRHGHFPKGSGDGSNGQPVRTIELVPDIPR